MTQMAIRAAKVFALLLLFMAGEAAAATCTSVRSGNWNTTTTWSCTGGTTRPGTGDSVIIVSPHTVTLDGNRFATNLQIDVGATLDDNGRDLTVSGSVAINGTYDGTGNNGNLIMTGNGQTLSGTGTIIDIGRIQIDANITIPVGSNLDLTLQSEIRVGDQNPATLTIDGTITGTGQTSGNRIIRADNNNVSNVVINGTVNAPNSFVEVQAGGTVTNNGTVALQYLDGNGDATSVWTQGADSSLTLTMPAVSWVGTFDASATGNTVTFDGTATPFNPATYYNLAGTGVTCPLPAGITVLGSTPCGPGVPTVATNAATALTTTGATLNGVVSSNSAVTTVSFEYGLTAAYGDTVVAAQSPLAAGAANSPVTAALSGLTCGTLYHFRAVGTNSYGNAYGGDRTFTTSACPQASFVFTNSPCVHNIAFGATGQTCAKIVWSPQVAGQNLAGVYITAVNINTGVPTRLSLLSVRTRNMQFGLSCHNPVANAGVQAVFAGRTLPLCQANGAVPVAWSTPTVPVVFNAGIPSSAASYTFNYADVGSVELWMRNSTTPTQVGFSGPFVVKPGGFVLSAITRTSDGFANPGAANANGTRFVKAGEAFSVTVTATTCAPASATCTVAGAATPNYGQETVPKESVRFVDVSLLPADANYADHATLVGGLGLTSNPAMVGTFGTFASGVATGTAFAWSDVGIITLTPSVGDGDYLGVGDVIGTTTGNVGRFYPDHFDTTLTATATAPMPCPTGLACPVNGFVYSGQPFSVQVTAKNLVGGTTANYAGTFAKAVTLAAWNALGSTTTQNPGAGNLTNNSIRAGRFKAGVAGMLTGTVGVTQGSATVTGAGTLFTTELAAGDVVNISGVNYTISAIPNDTSLDLAAPYAAATAAGLTAFVWPSYALSVAETAPTDIYIRADEPAGVDGVTSLRAVPADSVEGGVKVASGHIKLSNAHGSELLPLPLTATVQYYNGTGWVTSATDGLTAFNTNLSTAGGNLVATIVKGLTGGISVVGPSNAAVEYGIRKLTLAKPGQAGSVNLTIDAPAYLPSNTARATFGVYKGNDAFIYLRENY